jgi:regulator of sirC expression with transglutaminase-like and TPR domain
VVDHALRAFRDAIAVPESELDLGAAALRIAQVEYPELAMAPYLDQLDELARRSGASRLRDPETMVDRLRRFVFEEEGFRGNAGDYYDPRNSCLNDVLERKLGIPITLSLLLMEVGRRLGLPIEGVGLPGHFVVRVRVGARHLLLDPFNGGSVLTPDAAASVVARAVGKPVEILDAHWAPCGKRQILVRMLRNLKTVYAQRETWERALAVTDRLLLLEPDSPIHLRDRGTILIKVGRLHDGAAEWERYLTRHADAPDAASFRRELRRVRQELGARN